MNENIDVSKDVSNTPADQISHNIEAAKTLLDEWISRHQHCWRLLTRYCLTGLTFAIAPYAWVLKDGLQVLPQVGKPLLFFPFASIILAQIAILLFAKEYVRCRPVEAMYNKVMGPYSANLVSTKVTPTVKQGVAQITILMVGFASLLISLLNMLVLVIIGKIDAGFYYNGFFWGIAIIAALVCLNANWNLAQSARVEVNARICEQFTFDDQGKPLRPRLATDCAQHHISTTSNTI